MHKKKGDTLIEVALAIGIFSLVAIVVVSVISASTSSAQSSLELTITREELDSQAEALRFIHDSYAIGSQSMKSSENDYAPIWQAITSHAKEEENAKDEIGYIPTTCSELYTANGFMSETITKPFVINTRQLGSLDSDKIVIDSNRKSIDTYGYFYEPSTYPRILYGDALNSSLYDPSEETEDTIKRIEGIYITVVSGKSKVVSNANPEDEIKIDPTKAYYDFYIHSCWMPPGSERASTISTVIRLYDPAVIEY